MAKRTLSIGKMRGLQSTSTGEGVFAILAFDHRQSFIKMLDLDGELGNYPEIARAKKQIVEALAPHASAVLLDPVFSAAQAIDSGALPRDTGLLVSVEETGYTGDPTARESSLLIGWSPAKAKRMGADAVKLLIYYHPEAGEITARQEQLIEGVCEECREADIAFYLEALSYSIDPAVDTKSEAFAKARPSLVTQIARRLGEFGPEVLKLEFPVDAGYSKDESHWMEACQAVSEASPCPWAVLSAGVEYEVFVKQVKVACISGASGYIAGRAVWQEGIPLPRAERQAWIEGVAAKRLDELKQIAVGHARPWTSFYGREGLEGLEGWYQSYAT